MKAMDKPLEYIPSLLNKAEKIPRKKMKIIRKSF